jgi:hypothetical protein
MTSVLVTALLSTLALAASVALPNRAFADDYTGSKLDSTFFESVESLARNDPPAVMQFHLEIPLSKQISHAKLTCSALDSGVSMGAIAKVVVSSAIENWPTDEAARDEFYRYTINLDVAGIYTYCPWNKSKLESIGRLDDAFPDSRESLYY